MIFRLFDFCGYMLLGAVGIQKLAADINDLSAVPFHRQARLCGHCCDGRRFKVFGARKVNKRLNVFLFDHDRHSFLRFAYRKFGTVKTFIFFRNGVEIDVESVRKFSDSDGNSAGSEIVTAFYHA